MSSHSSKNGVQLVWDVENMGDVVKFYIPTQYIFALSLKYHFSKHSHKVNLNIID